MPPHADPEAPASVRTRPPTASTTYGTLRALSMALIVCAACVLRLPGFRAGPHSDDYLQAAMLDGTFPAARSPLALYDFGGRDRAERARLRDFGWFAWWSAPELKLAMFRPLSSALVAVDHELFRVDPLLPHALSALVLTALLCGVAMLLVDLLPWPVPPLALALFAADPSLSIPFSWLPNRCALTAAAFGVWGLLAYLRWRRRGGAPLAVVAVSAFALGALAGEYALALAGYVLAFECSAADDALHSRLRGAALALSPMLGVEVVGAWLGYGVRDSGLYVSPLLEPLRYAGACIERIPVLAAELVGAVPAAWSTRAPAFVGQHALALTASIAALLSMAVMARLLVTRASPELRLLGLGSLLGLPLLAGAVPEARLLVPIAFGFDAVVAVALLALLRIALGRGPAVGRAQRGLAAALAIAIVGVHLGVKPARALAATQTLRARITSHTRWALEADVDDRAARGQQWFVIAATDFTTTTILPFARHFYGHALPRAYRVLSTAPHAHEIARIDRHTLELTVLGSALQGAFAGSLQRPASLPFRAGDEVQAGDLHVSVLRAWEGQPVRMRFAFQKPADDVSYVFLYPMRDGVRRIVIPPVGGTLRLPAPRAPRLHAQE